MGKRHSISVQRVHGGSRNDLARLSIDLDDSPLTIRDAVIGHFDHVDITLNFADLGRIARAIDRFLIDQGQFLGRPHQEGASRNPTASHAGAAAEDGRTSRATAAAPPFSHLRECSEATKGVSELIGPELPDDRHSVIEDDD